MIRTRFGYLDINDYINLIHAVAWHFAEKSVIDYQDLFSEASLAYCESIRKFEPHRGVKFSTFIWRCMRNHLVNYIKRETNLRNKYIDIEGKEQDNMDFNFEIICLDNQSEYDAFMNSPENFEGITPFKEAISEWPEEAQIIVALVLRAPEHFEGKTPNFKRRKESKQTRLKKALRQLGWFEQDIVEALAETKNLVQTL